MLKTKKSLLETAHNTELTETAVTSEMIVTHPALVRLLLNNGIVKERIVREREETYGHGRAGQHCVPFV